MRGYPASTSTGPGVNLPTISASRGQQPKDLFPASPTNSGGGLDRPGIGIYTQGVTPTSASSSVRSTNHLTDRESVTSTGGVSFARHRGGRRETDATQGVDGLVEHCGAVVEVRAQRRELRPQVPRTHPDDQTPTGEVAQGNQRLDGKIQVAEGQHLADGAR